MTLSLILPKIYLLKCHLQENKTDTLRFLHLHFKQAQEHLRIAMDGTPPLTCLWQAAICTRPDAAFPLQHQAKNSSFYYYPEHSGE